MAGTLIGEITGKEYDAEIDGDTATRRFRIKSDDRSDDGPDIIPVAGILYKEPHPKNGYILATTFSAVQDESCWWKWDVSILYEKTEDEEEEEPEDRSPKISIDTEETPIAAIAGYDSSGSPVALTNSAGEPYDPPPEDEVSILVINIERKESVNISVLKFYNYNNVTNSNALVFGDATFPAGSVLLRIRSGPRESYQIPNNGGTSYFRTVAYTLRVNPLGWDHNILDQGTYYLEAGDRKPFMTDKPAEPYIGLLDGSGAKSKTPVFNNHPRKRRRDFGTLALPAGP